MKNEITMVPLSPVTGVVDARMQLRFATHRHTDAAYAMNLTAELMAALEDVAKGGGRSKIDAILDRLEQANDFGNLTIIWSDHANRIESTVAPD